MRHCQVTGNVSFFQVLLLRFGVELDGALLRQGLLIPHSPGQRPLCPRSTQTPSGLEVFGVAGEPGPA